MPAILAVLLGALPLAWPALWNGYPVLFTDSGGFLHQTLGPLMIWDKPWIYGPMIHPFHARVTLWGAIAAQALLVSHLLWLTARAMGVAGAGRHVAICAGLAALTTAPFSVALIMPDILAPVVLLALFLLGFAADRLRRAETVYLFVLASLAIAAHLSHIPLALALIVMTALLTWRLAPILRVTCPLLAAVLLLITTNAVGHGRASLSPHGSTFALARLLADGPAARTLAAECPARGWYLCDFVGWFPMDSDDFLWRPESPLNRDATGRPRFLGGALLSAEAREIVAETLRREPVPVALAFVRNTLRQTLLVKAGDTLIPTDLDVAVRPRIAEMNAAELARYDASRQRAGELTILGEALVWPHRAALVLAGLLVLAALWRRRAEARWFALLAFVVIGLAANAAATGGLSKPHHRYQARIVWLLPFAAALLVIPRAPPPRAG